MKKFTVKETFIKFMESYENKDSLYFCAKIGCSLCPFTKSNIHNCFFSKVVEKRVVSKETLAKYFIKKFPNLILEEEN